MCKSGSARAHSLVVSSTSSSSSSFQAISFDESDLRNDYDTKKVQLTNRLRLCSSSSLPQPSGLRMAARAKIHNDKLIATHKACLASLADLIATQREDIDMLNEYTRRAEMGIPPLLKQVREKSRRDLMKLLTEAVNVNFHDLAVLKKKNRGRILPEEAETIAHKINSERQVQADLVNEATAIFEELKKKIAKMAAEHSILLWSCCDNCGIVMGTASAA